ncbi:MAG: hypothetical protein HYV08_14185 [Deltaproteobacteria bacterium]|nr:hypothetical protein [Deltaproteobacteria bacterium]MBI3075997.1 hypothetical protein [Deltaproteobacteria bacterium]
MWITPVPEDQAEGAVKQVYEEHRQKFGFVTNVAKIFSLRPDLIKKYEDFCSGIIFGGAALGRRRAEMIAIYVSGLLRCTY